MSGAIHLSLKIPTLKMKTDPNYSVVGIFTVPPIRNPFAIPDIPQSLFIHFKPPYNK